MADDQWGQKLLSNFQKEGVDTRCATIVEGEVSSFSLILSASSGERTILYEPGTNEHLHDANFSKETLTQMDWVYLNHIQEHSNVIQDDIIEILTKKGVVHFTWNPGGHQIDAGTQEENNSKLLAQTDLLLLNKEEALRFTGEKGIKDAIKHLKDLGVRIVCVTDGGNGTTASDGTALYHCPVASDVQVVDTTGAGDAFGIGATWALLQGMDLPNALRAGTINAASVISALGAQAGLLTETKMHERLKSAPIKVTVKQLA
jgi:sugar/nucleoside kinase (ribokinase family)